MAAQATGAFLASSLAIAADCANLASIVIGLIMSMIALYKSKKDPTKHYTFGMQRLHVLGNIVSIVCLLVMTTWFCIVAFKRFFRDYHIDGEIMLVTAILSIINSLIMSKVLY